MNRVERLEKLMSNIDNPHSLIDPGYQEFFMNDGDLPAESVKLPHGVVHKPISAKGKMTSQIVMILFFTV